MSEIDPPIISSVHMAPEARLFSDRYRMMEWINLPTRPLIAEAGVAYGDFSEFMMDLYDPREFHAFDMFGIHEQERFWDDNTFEKFGGRTHREFYEARFVERPIRTFQGDSGPLLSQQPPETYDLVYIDAAHDYTEVKRDAEAALKIIKTTGILVFNDYTMYDPTGSQQYGVVHVANTVCVEHGWKMMALGLQQHMFCDVALKKF